ncbi:hypothetical protein IGI04_002950 [Brassica rapa subsp. trilocularis]|uniref:AB hydrolase-1 domain-containing protein n=1 Tax=Brassica rapa subsp. trilocularis TaxID=1813537 RepID=A0ABQ7NWZ6_BRACM|nr:hypothetical protein IGI04_002950 [Brassica rapa subsp. trilocularis]
MGVNQKISGLAAVMNAKIIGSGERSMVLAHGFGGDQSVWEKIIPVLSQSFEVLVFDWPFSGAIKDQTLCDPSKYNSFDAFSDDLISLMEELKFGPVVFVGHSMSGMIGCSASIKRPDLFTNLVLIAASPRWSRPGCRTNSATLITPGGPGAAAGPGAGAAAGAGAAGASNGEGDVWYELWGETES